MSFIQTSKVGDMTRGGQLLLHFFRMLGQVARKMTGLMLALAVVLFVLLFLWRTSEYERYITLRYWTASLDYALFPNHSKPTTVLAADGRVVRIQVSDFVANQNVRATALRVSRHAAALFVASTIVVSGAFLLIVVYIYRMGFRQRQEQHLRGARLVTARDYRRHHARHFGRGALMLGGVPLAPGVETSHLLVMGAPGTGKTTALLELLDTIRKRGERVICFSPSGDFIQAFCREESDTVLNPFDERCPAWDLWEDCPNDYDYDSLAAALIPEHDKSADPFWTTAARSVLSSLAQEMRRRGEHTAGIERLLELLSLAPLETLHSYLATTEAGAQLDPAAEKAALSIRLTASTYARSLRYLNRSGRKFNIRQWVQDESTDGWIFLNCNNSQLASVRPLLSMWLEVLTHALLALGDSRTRRVWLVLDELPSLQRIPSLESYLAQGRKHGGCGVIAFQVISQLRDTYGKEAAQTIAGLCSTWLCLRQRDPETAKWVAESFGHVEVVEANQGLSYGANDMRDGVSLSSQRKTRPLLLDAEITNLPNFRGYLRTPGANDSRVATPAIEVEFSYRAFRAQAPAYVPRTHQESDDTEASAQAPQSAAAVDPALADVVTDGPLEAPRLATTNAAQGGV